MKSLKSTVLLSRVDKYTLEAEGSERLAARDISQVEPGKLLLCKKVS